jgi:hypothetical protein
VARVSRWFADERSWHFHKTPVHGRFGAMIREIQDRRNYPTLSKASGVLGVISSVTNLQISKPFEILLKFGHFFPPTGLPNIRFPMIAL